MDLRVDRIKCVAYFKVCGQAPYIVSTIVYTIGVKLCTNDVLHTSIWDHIFHTPVCIVGYIVSYSLASNRWPPLGHWASYCIRNKYTRSTHQVDWNKGRTKLCFAFLWHQVWVAGNLKKITIFWVWNHKDVVFGQQPTSYALYCICTIAQKRYVFYSKSPRKCIVPNWYLAYLKHPESKDSSKFGWISSTLNAPEDFYHMLYIDGARFNGK
jgi:hypothetical protein